MLIQCHLSATWSTGGKCSCPPLFQTARGCQERPDCCHNSSPISTARDEISPTLMLKTEAGLCFEVAWLSSPQELTHLLNIRIKMRKSCLNRDYETLSVSLRAFCCFRSFLHPPKSLRDLHTASGTQILMTICAERCFEAERRKWG